MVNGETTSLELRGKISRLFKSLQTFRTPRSIGSQRAQLREPPRDARCWVTFSMHCSILHISEALCLFSWTFYSS